MRGVGEVLVAQVGAGHRIGGGLRPLRSLPSVTRRRAKEHGTYHDVLRRYLALPMEPLLVSATLTSPMIVNVDGGVHLDALLTWAVTEDFPCPTIHDDHSATAVVPLPVRLLWVDARGLPLWAASDLVPIGQWESETVYFHKRYPSDRVEWCRSPNALTTAGRWKEARLPFPRRVPHADAELCGMVLGNRAEIERLLTGYVTHVGRKVAAGNGRVAQWSVAPLAVDGETALGRILDGRCTPVDYYVERGTAQSQGADFERRLLPSRCWTPPYWYAPYASTVVAPVRA